MNLAKSSSSPARVQLVLYIAPLSDGEMVRLEPPPATWEECRSGAVERPCQRSCRHNTGIRLAEERPGRRWQGGEDRADAWSPEHAGCALDEAGRGGMERGEVARKLGVTRERVRQIEESGLRKLRAMGADVDHLIEALVTGDSGTGNKSP